MGLRAAFIPLADLLPPPMRSRALLWMIERHEGRDGVKICQQVVMKTPPHVAAEALGRISGCLLDDLRRCRLTGRGWSQAVATALHDADSLTRLRALSLAPSLSDLSLTLPAIGHCFAHPHRPTRMKAGEALLQCILAALGVTGSRQPGWRNAEAIDQALSAAVLSWHLHRSDEVLLAAAIASRRGGALLEQALRDERSAAMFSMRGLLKQTETPLIEQNLIRWIGSGAIGRAAAIALMQLNAGQLAAVLPAGYLLRSPARRRALAACRRQRLTVDDRSLQSASVLVQRGLVDFLNGAPIPPFERLERLSSCATLADPLARMRAVQSIAHRARADERHHLLPYLFDPAAPVAHAAALALLACPDPSDMELPTRGVRRSVHPTVRNAAAQRDGRASVTRFVSSLGSMPMASVHALARFHLQQDASGFIGAIRAEWTSGRTDALHHLIPLIRRLHLADRFESELIVISASRESRLASAAILALGELDSARAAAAVRAGLRHADPRVQANAVEAIGRGRLPTSLGLIEPLIHSRNARARANALVILIRDGRLPESSAEAMLRDIEPAHRRSGGWVQSRLAGLVGNRQGHSCE